MSRTARPAGGLALALSVVVALGACQVIAGLTGDRELGSQGGVGVQAGTGAGGKSGSSGTQTGGSNSGMGGSRPSGGSSPVGGVGGDGGEAGGEGGSMGGMSGMSDGGVSGTGGSSGSGPLLPAKSCDETTLCNDESACTTLYVPGGPFAMGRSTNGTDSDLSGKPNEQPEHSVRVSSFWLDKYEVTIGRFRSFVDRYDGTKPERDAGAHPNNPPSGWQPEWDDYLPSNNAELRTSLIASDPNCNENFRSWTPAAGNAECLPVNCIDWYVAFAFCIWDGGRLPTEAEWEYAAAGGAQNRRFPWGSTLPDNDRAIFQCTASPDPICSPGDIRPVGSTMTTGYGLFGQADLAGSMLERTRDVFDPSFYRLSVAGGTDVVNLVLDTSIVESPARGGSYRANGTELRAALRENVYRSSRWDGVGLRCARNP